MVSVNATPAPPNPISFGLTRVLLFIAGYVALALIGQWLAHTPGRSAPILLSGGLYLAMLLSSDRRDWLRWAALAFVLEALVESGLYHEDAIAALIDALGHTLGLLAAAHLVRVWRGLPYQLSTLPDVMAFSCAAAVSPLAGIALDLMFSSVSGPDITGTHWLIYWRGNRGAEIAIA